MPAWARTGNHPDFPRTEFLVGIGQSRSALKSGNQATASLEENLCSYALERGSNAIAGSRFETLVMNSAQWFDATEFDRAVKEARATDGFDFVVIKAIKKADLHIRARLMLPKAKKVLDETIAPSLLLGSIRDMLKKQVDYFVLTMRVVCLQLLADGSLDQQAFEKAEEAAVLLWEFPMQVTIIKGGEHQVAQIRGGVSKPLTMQLVYRNRVVSGLPIRWALVSGQMGGVRGDLETDAMGKADAHVMHIAASGEGVGFVQAYPDIVKIAGRKIGILMSVWLWQVKLPNRDSAALRVDVIETSNNNALPCKFNSAFVKWAKDAGYTILEEGEPAGEYDYILNVKGSISISTWMQNEIPKVRVTGDLIVEDARTGKNLFRINPGGIGEGSKGNSEISVSLRAHVETVGTAVTEISSRVKSFLPGAKSWVITPKNKKSKNLEN